MEDHDAMRFDLLDLLMRPEAYVCIWRDGELYVQPLTEIIAETAEGSAQARKDADEPIAA